ncbi:MAG: hypothetical protein JWO78_1134 [Micavibrio sp.]|nr:hypothetical protein [Micavibrio sp.]
MNNLERPVSQLRNLLKNAARSGETACISASNLSAAEKIATQDKLAVEIYVIPDTKEKPQPR